MLRCRRTARQFHCPEGDHQVPCLRLVAGIGLVAAQWGQVLCGVSGRAVLPPVAGGTLPAGRWGELGQGLLLLLALLWLLLPGPGSLDAGVAELMDGS